MRIIYKSIEEYILTCIRIAKEEITVFCPFIKIDPLTRLLSSPDSYMKVNIITTWKLENFLTGVSDVELFSFCANREIDLRANNRLHMKVWLIDRSQILATSANISDRALGAADNFNYEFLVESVATATDLKTIDAIKDESIIIDQNIYNKTVQLIEANSAPIMAENTNDLLPTEYSNACYVDDLPLVNTPQDLYEIYSKYSLVACPPEVQHDIERLGLPEGLDQISFTIAVERSFFRLPIIRCVVDRLHKNSFFFGEMKKFLQELHDSNPKPFRRELTQVTQNLFKWLVELRPEEFKVEKPHISERISYLN